MNHRTLNGCKRFLFHHQATRLPGLGLALGRRPITARTTTTTTASSIRMRIGHFAGMGFGIQRFSSTPSTARSNSTSWSKRNPKWQSKSKSLFGNYKLIGLAAFFTLTATATVIFYSRDLMTLSSSSQKSLLLHCDESNNSIVLENEVDKEKDYYSNDDGDDPSALPSSVQLNQHSGKSKLTFWELVGRIWSLVSPDWILLGCIGFVTGLGAFVNVQTPIGIGKLVSIVQASLSATSSLEKAAHQVLLYQAAARLLAMFLSGAFLAFLDIYLVTIMGERLSLRLKTRLYSTFLSAPVSFFEYRDGGSDIDISETNHHLQATTHDLVCRITTDLYDFKHTFKQSLTTGLKALLQGVGTVYSLLQISPVLCGMVGLVVSPLYALLYFYGKYLRFLALKVKEEEGGAMDRPGQVLGNIKTVKACNGHFHELEIFQAQHLEIGGLGRMLGFHVGVFQGLQIFSIGGMVLGVLYFGGELVGMGQLSGGELMGFMAGMQGLVRSLSATGVFMGKLVKTATSAMRVFEYMDGKDGDGREQFMIKDGDKSSRADYNSDIFFENITFRYPSRPGKKVLIDFDLVLPAGKVVALVGASGSGKSTVAQLLERFYPPSSGRIFIGETDVSTIDPNSFRERIGYINQDPVLFPGTIKENIKYGAGRVASSISDTKVEEVCRVADCWEFINEFPMGLETLVGERGASLSGGQKQRIAIARALIGDPDILILDEATSALDTHSEAQVQSALDKACKGRTTLVIAHRLSTIRNADMIVVLGAGGVVLEQGRGHDELMKKNGVYFDMYRKSISTGSA